MKLIPTAHSALEDRFQRLHSGRYRRRLRSRRDSSHNPNGPTSSGNTPKKAA